MTAKPPIDNPAVENPADESALTKATAFLKTVRTASLATTDSSALPHAANIQFLSDDDCHLYFLSSEKSQHARHIALQQRIALSAYDHDDRPHMIRGVQLHGRCMAIVSHAKRESVMGAYCGKFPIAADPSFTQIVRRQTLYEITPTWLRWIDNRVQFGFKLEWVLEK